ncbi:nitroreductase family protein, partial [Mycobacterium tuberculosis]|nr:nitroreductase family protein [Mycobacterium tuberculosis]
MSNVLNDAALDQLFRTARTQNAFLDKPVEDSQLKALYELLKWGPTAANGSPARFVFVKSPEAKAKLAPALSEG